MYAKPNVDRPYGKGWYDARVDWVEEGGVETVAMDSGHHLCRWHRVFLDVCLPEGAAVTVFARTSDNLEPEAFVVAPTPPPGLAGVDSVTPLSSLHPLGDPDLDTTGWVEVPDLVDIGPDGDVPHPFGAAPHHDAQWTTLEGLITAPPGRYLWIRLLMTGTRRATPRLWSARCTLPRPDILGLLPSFWKRDPLRADVMERVLMLFERELSRFDQLALHLPYLFDPRVTPPEALDWLGSWLGMVLDDRIGLDAQRSLATEAVELYRTRGTVPGMTRVAEIVSGVPAIVIEAFRERRGEMSLLGADGARLGEGIGLGAPPVMGADDVERRLVDGWTAGIARREERRATTGRACPEDAPPSPRLDPAERHFALHAHRFTVILVGDVCDERYAATHDAIERWKPAHTLHEVCTVSPGARLGITSRPGMATLVADEAPTAAVLADQGVPLGTQFIIGEHAVRRRIDQEKPR